MGTGAGATSKHRPANKGQSISEQLQVAFITGTKKINGTMPKAKSH